MAYYITLLKLSSIKQNGDFTDGIKPAAVDLMFIIICGLIIPLLPIIIKEKFYETVH
jgi:hypothetical protein